jgi:hypothetical protein
MLFMNMWVPVKMLHLEPWQWMVKYFNPWRVIGSSLSWGLAAGGLFALVRPQQPRAIGSGGFGTSSNILQRKREKRILENVAGTSHPADGTIIGVEEKTGKQVIVTDVEANSHQLACGTTNSGKTTTVMNYAESAAQREIACFYVDGKGEKEVIDRMRGYAEKYGRFFTAFSMRGGYSRYNPLRYGGVTELTDKLMTIEEWSDPYYESMARRYLQVAFRCLLESGISVDLPNLVSYLNVKRLENLARQLADQNAQEEILEALESYRRSDEIKGLVARLATLVESEIGHLFKAQGEGDLLDPEEVIRKGGLAVFSLNSLAFPEYSRTLGKIIVTDLKAVADRQLGNRPIYMILDEFNVFASAAIVDLIGKARSKGFCTVMAMQSLSDIEAACGPAVVDQILDNSNIYLIHRVNSPRTAQVLADVVGTVQAKEITRQVQHIGPFSVPTGVGTEKDVKEYPVHPDDIKWLRKGEIVYVNKPARVVKKVLVRKPS